MNDEEEEEKEEEEKKRREEEEEENEPLSPLSSWIHILDLPLDITPSYNWYQNPLHSQIVFRSANVA